MENDTPPAPPPARKDRPADEPGESAEASQHRDGASEIGDRVGPNDEAKPDPNVSG